MLKGLCNDISHEGFGKSLKIPPPGGIKSIKVGVQTEDINWSAIPSYLFVKFFRRGDIRGSDN